ncbi:Sigma-54 dependent transcriptional regulator [Candidatus Magnetoovum chiemensis]|nr:Sigma-54 dependent transcriptional regulator [Candidatus Magnetoovum chiemensis]
MIIKIRKPTILAIDHYKLLRYLKEPVEYSEQKDSPVIVVKRRAKAKLMYEKTLEDKAAEEAVQYYSPVKPAFYTRIDEESQVIKRVLTKLEKVAASKYSVIIQGEPGTGKSLLAYAIHELSARVFEPFIRIDLQSIPEEELESKLFGYEKGASGADKKQKGYFKVAHKGTVFIDEIQNLSLATQAKLLNVVEDKKLYPIGSTRASKVDIRIIAATNMDLQNSVLEQKIREDLYFRLSEFIIALPALRERKKDLPMLAAGFLEETCTELSIREKTLTDSAIKFLTDYDWPGNVRELKNLIRKAVLLCDETEITNEHLSDIVSGKLKEEDKPQILPLKEVASKAIREAESKAITNALILTRGNKAKAASQLKIDYKTLLTKIKEYDIPEHITQRS